MTSTSKQAIAEAAEILRRGGIVAFPTETVYGLGANALDPRAVARIFETKGRPATSPVIVHVDSPEMASRYAASWPETAARLAARFWPGPLTLVLDKDPAIPDIVTAGLGTVGLRMPAHPVALELIETARLPVAAPSANRFTELSPTSAEHVRRSLGAAVDLVLDGGSTPVGIESTVLSLAGAAPVLLRPGMITREEIEEITGPVLSPEGELQGAHPSPGMHPRHYAPRTPLLLTKGPPALAGRGHYLKLDSSPRQFAAAMYARLHDLDALGLDWIAVEEPPALPEWAGIRDRLLRASRPNGLP